MPKQWPKYLTRRSRPRLNLPKRQRQLDQLFKRDRKAVFDLALATEQLTHHCRGGWPAEPVCLPAYDPQLFESRHQRLAGYRSEALRYGWE